MLIKMDQLILIVGKFTPLIFSLIGLWIKPFDKSERLTNAGKYIIPGLVASAILIFSADKLNNTLSRISAEKEKQSALYEQTILFNPIRPSDISIKLSGTSESVATSTHPKFLKRNWEIYVEGLRGSSVFYKNEPAKHANDEEEGTLFKEEVTYSDFVGDFGKLSNADAWNGDSISFGMYGLRDFFPPDIRLWILNDTDQDFAYNSEKEIDTLSAPDEEDPDEIGEWRMLPMRLRVDLNVKGKNVATTSGYLVYKRYPANYDNDPGTVYPLFDSFVIPTHAFPTKEDYMKPTSESDLTTCTLMRVFAWTSFIAITILVSIAITTQLRTQKKAAANKSIAARGTDE